MRQSLEPNWSDIAANWSDIEVVMTQAGVIRAKALLALARIYLEPMQNLDFCVFDARIT